MPASLRSAIFRVTIVWAALMLGRFCPASEVETVDLNSPVLAAMRSPVTLIVDGVAFAGAVGQIAMADQSNVWIDRGIDPTSPVMLGPLGPTRFDALRTLAKSRGAIVTVVADVVLVGRPGAVDRAGEKMAAALKRDSVIEPQIIWPEATTPNEALAIVLGDERRPPLPHDLWPATAWTNMTPAVAAALILAQFDAIETGDSPARDGKWPRRYPTEFAKQLRGIIRGIDPAASFQTKGKWIEVTADSEAHRAALEALLTIQVAVPKQATSNFSLRATESAEAILRQLTAAAKTNLVIDDRAAQAARVPIAVEASATSVKLLIDEVARQAGLTTRWTGDTVRIEMP